MKKKNDYRLFERLFQSIEERCFPYGISFFVSEIFMFLYFMLQMWKVLERCILTYNKHLLTDVNKYQCLTNDIVCETDKQNSNRPM